MLPPCSVGRKNQSIAWNHFDKLPDPNPLSQAKCRHCGSLIKYSSGTITMHIHLDRCKKKSDIMSKRQKLDSSSTTITPSSSSMIEQEACWIALVKLFVELELSFPLWDWNENLGNVYFQGGELTCKLKEKVESSLRSLFEEYSSGGGEVEVSSQEA
ncbi:hypothetical protein JHK82_016183 [Glycine max]|nr:hypothetical protein JHK85_016582 [Glycine max]KAG5046807.1 hypothetical protein JHK86_016213 [Glycine max]KAG5149302.1 hypothetical protein JHK82_016183 [Glycine max]